VIRPKHVVSAINLAYHQFTGCVLTPLPAPSYYLDLRSTTTQLPLQYVHSSPCSRTSFLYEVLHLSVFWLVPSFLKKAGSLQSSPSENVVFKEHLYPAIYPYHKKENLSFMEMKCVRPLPLLVTG